MTGFPIIQESVAGSLTAGEQLVIQAIADGTYFVENEVPVGDIDDANAVYTLAGTPNPETSLELKKNGAYQKAGGEDFTLVGDTITFVSPPESGSLILATYRISPV
jgi:hypothetical protein